jgi:hypothetical protein
VADFESREITDSRKFRIRKIIYSETGGYVLTPFLEKTGQTRAGEAADEKHSIIGRLEEEQSCRQDPPMVRRVKP